MSAQHSLFHFCKKGNLDELKFIVETKEIDLNDRDSWDSTPLYYACLCGHRDIVEYLLQNGAKCEASTFDGERCLYGALTNDIKNMIKNWKQIHSTGKRRDRHYELMRHLYEDDVDNKDIVFNVHGVEFAAHRCILSARSSFFANAISTAGRWAHREIITIRKSKISSDSFKALMQFIYLGRVDVDLHLVDELRILANQCGLSYLTEEIDVARDRISNLVRLKPTMKQKIKIFSVESEPCFAKLTSDLRQLVEESLPISLRSWVDEGVLPFADDSGRINFYPDLCVKVEGHQFMCHEVFLCGRSDYFKALLTDHFHENKTQEETTIPVITLQHVTANIFKHILIYIYSGTIEIQTLEDTFEMLPVADMMLLPGLKRLCGNLLARHLDDGNVVALYRFSQTFDLPNLHNSCTNFMAIELDKMTESEEFIELAMEEAFSVTKREETDSIPIIDDIRYHVTIMVTTYSQMEEANLKLSKLDALLSRLGIEC